MKVLRSTVALSAIAAAMLSSNASAVNLTTGGVGEVAIAPFYTVRDGWSTLINLTNTTDSPIIVKVRFHEGANSRDVLDFNVALSSFDVFTGIVRENANGIAEFAATDQANDLGKVTCTIPSVVATTPQRLNPLGFSGGTGTQTNDDGGLGGDTGFANPNAGAIERLSEGYVEFVVMGYADNFYADAAFPVNLTGLEGVSSNTGNDTTGLAGAINIARAIEQHDCASLDKAFNVTTNPNTGNRYILDTARQMGEPINALKFNFRLLNGARGTEAGSNTTTWANFFNPLGFGIPDGSWQPLDDKLCVTTRGDFRSNGIVGPTEWSPNDTSDGATPNVNGESCNNLVTAQTQYPFLEPSLNDAFPATGAWFSDELNTLDARTSVGATVASDARPRGVDAVSATLQNSAVLNEWSSNSALGVSTDWIVTLPTKSFYVDQGRGPQFGMTLSETNAVVPTFGRPDACTTTDLDGGADGVDFDTDDANALTFDCEEAPYPPFVRPFAQLVPADRSSASSCNTIGFVFFDRAEQTIVPLDPGVIVSPAPPPTLDTDSLCFEANVITFNGGTAIDPVHSVNVDTAPLTAEAGWMFIALDAEADADLGPLVGGTVTRGLPITGFMLKQRNFGDVTKNFASSIDHGYVR
ncbi:MAG: hypothetical protein WC809_12535 [Sinimarinibacterium sp.]|jgi:hypothetical protein